MQANQMFTKQRLETVVYKRSGLLNSVKSTKSMFDTVMKLGIPSFFDGDGYLYDLDKYEEKLMENGMIMMSLKNWILSRGRVSFIYCRMISRYS